MEFQDRVRASKPGFRIGLRMVSNRGLDLCFKPLLGCQTSVRFSKSGFKLGRVFPRRGMKFSLKPMLGFQIKAFHSGFEFPIGVQVANTSDKP